MYEANLLEGNYCMEHIPMLCKYTLAIFSRTKIDTSVLKVLVAWHKAQSYVYIFCTLHKLFTQYRNLTFLFLCTTFFKNLKRCNLNVLNVLMASHISTMTFACVLHFLKNHKMYTKYKNLTFSIFVHHFCQAL